MAEFNRIDVIKVALAMTENSVTREYQGDYGMHEYLNECQHCSGSFPDDEQFKHELDCPVLIAQDLLT